MKICLNAATPDVDDAVAGGGDGRHGAVGDAAAVPVHTRIAAHQPPRLSRGNIQLDEVDIGILYIFSWMQILRNRRNVHCTVNYDLTRFFSINASSIAGVQLFNFLTGIWKR